LLCVTGWVVRKLILNEYRFQDVYWGSASIKGRGEIGAYWAEELSCSAVSTKLWPTLQGTSQL
jgi:hypothetical protein